MDLDTLGKRVADVRAHLGSRPAKPLSLRDFVRLIEERTGQKVLYTEMSLMERDERGLSLELIEAIALLDPLGRGREWLAWGGPTPGETPTVPLEQVVPKRQTQVATKRSRGKR